MLSVQRFTDAHTISIVADWVQAFKESPQGFTSFSALLEQCESYERKGIGRSRVVAKDDEKGNEKKDDDKLKHEKKEKKNIRKISTTQTFRLLRLVQLKRAPMSPRKIGRN